MKKLIFPVALLAMVVAASCNKDKVAVTPGEHKQNGGMVAMAGNSGFGSLELYEGKMRKALADYTDCEAIEDLCAPEDIVIKGGQQSALDVAILNGAQRVKELFQKEETALIYFPNWNDAWFADVKAALLSGNYTFKKAGTSMYFLGKAESVSTESYDYVVKYNVQ
ncbi:MAG: hypothetical protein EOO01_04765 [Chitinophagaceae bacterium]|nr:MAG: hypothetical protein EOO01_04765 [Chitinophagaceae bacterium]